MSTSDTLFSLIESRIKILRPGMFTDFKLHLHAGGKFNIVLNCIHLGRRSDDPDRLYVRVYAKYRVGNQRHCSTHFKDIPHIFGDSGLVTAAENRTVIEAALKSFISNVQQICHRCFKHNDDSESLDEKTLMCQSCCMELALASLLGENKVEIGKYQQAECAICKEYFTPSSFTARPNKCDISFITTASPNWRKASAHLQNTIYTH